MGSGDQPPGRTRVVVIDDDATYRAILRIATRLERLIELVGEDATGAGAVELVERTKPDVVLLDLALPKIDGLTLLPDLVAATGPGRVLVVSDNAYPPLRDAVLEAGATGLLPKEPVKTLPSRILEAIG